METMVPSDFCKKDRTLLQREPYRDNPVSTCYPVTQLAMRTSSSLAQCLLFKQNTGVDTPTQQTVISRSMTQCPHFPIKNEMTFIKTLDSIEEKVLNSFTNLQSSFLRACDLNHSVSLPESLYDSFCACFCV